MPVFGTESRKHLATLHPDLQAVMNEAIKHIDFSITCGHRGKEAQDAAVAAGNSKTPWPTSKHNASPSLAVDVAPYPVNWQDVEAFTYLNGYLCGVAATLGIKVRSGADWDGDLAVKEHAFLDRPHIELVE